MEYKSPTEKLKFTLDWTAEIGGSDISTSVWTVPAGLTNDTTSNTTTTTTTRLIGGTLGITYLIKNEVTNAAGDVFKKQFNLRVRDQLIG